MAKQRRSFHIPRSLVWGVALVVLSLIMALEGYNLWISASEETHDAFYVGRRIMIKLDSGDIQGKYIPDPDRAIKGDLLAGAAAAPKKTESMASEGSAAKASLDALPGLNPELAEKSAAGPLPIIGADGTKPWRFYAKPFEYSKGQPIIAIVVTGLGLSKTVTDEAIKLPGAITLSFSPYAKDTSSWTLSARATGHEILLDLPLEPSNYPLADPGPKALMTEKDAHENEERLYWVLSRSHSYVGVLTAQNEEFSSNSEIFKNLMQSLASRGLLLVMGREPHKSDIKEMIEGGNTASVISNMLIDEELSPTAIKTRLSSLEQLAKKRGYAVGVAQSFPLTMEELKIWSDELESRGVILVPISSVARLRFS